MPVGGQLRTDRTTGKHADHKITNAALGPPRRQMPTLVPV
jgi:hypothetical protein